ncbi:uncharacterized protein LOC128884125 isoform X2 [Hylaeus volcanicus]|uniref:uncharacterized protein LOC128884125 isoform X2 n=1 Tax=Hylaeus volcanicus TaxID=313075 RepID=UPI0023B7BB28|nr:uncharacterized protein LOC128884125 isoform X2 [Hylaeus volcanicus]
MADPKIAFENRPIVRCIRHDTNFAKVLLTVRESSLEELSALCPQSKASLLFYAVQRSHDIEVQELCRLLCQELCVCNPNHVDHNQQTALFFAARDGHVEAVRLLLSLGCSAGHRDSVEQTALFYAARDGRDKVLEILLENGVNINDADRLGQTALFYGARDGRTSTVELMLKHGANIHLNDRNRRTALYYATRSNHPEVIALLKSYEDVQSAPCDRQDSNLKKNLEPLGKSTNSDSNGSQLTTLNNNNDACYQPNKRTRLNDTLNETEKDFAKDAVPENVRPTHRRCYRLCIKGPETIQPEIQWLSAPLEQIQVFESLLPSIAVWSRESHCPVTDIFMSIRAMWQPIALSVLDELSQDKEGWIFQKPVDCKAWKCPDYYDVIKNPMDFFTMRKKFKAQLYPRCQDFVNDMELIFANCFRYNRPESNVAVFGRSIQAHYKALALEKGFERWITIENEIDQWYKSMYQSKKNEFEKFSNDRSNELNVSTSMITNVR